MENQRAYLFIFEGFADWEPASAVAELRRTFGFSVQTVGLTKHVVTSMGGIKVLPDLPISDAAPDLTHVLILPGGDAWMRGENPQVTTLLKTFAEARKPIAAICAATLSLAHAGILDNHRHTSNGDGFIARYVPSYKGQKLYQKMRAVTDGDVITANGLAPFAFAAEIFRKVVPNREDDITMYEGLYSRGLLDE